MENMPFLHSIIFYVLLSLCLLEGFGRILNKKGLGIKAGKWILKSILKFVAMLLKEGGKAFSKLAKSIK